MNEINLIIDGNYFFHRCIGVQDWKPFKKKDCLIFQDEESRKFLQTQVTTHFLSLLRKHQHINYKRIIFVADSHSWRYSLYQNYKGDRDLNRDDKKDWKQLGSIMKEWMELLPKYNVITTRLPQMEGDDLIYLWSKYLNNVQKESVIIIASDGDLKQLVSTNLKNETFTLHYNINKKGSYTFDVNTKELIEGFKIPEIDFFNISANKNVNNNIEFLKSLVDDKISTSFVHPIDFVFQKIFEGDNSDNISALYPGFGRASATKCVDYLLNIYSREELLDRILNEDLNDILIDIYKFIDETPRVRQPPIGTTNDDILKRIKLNTKLMYIHHQFYPKQCAKDFSLHLKESLNVIKPNLPKSKEEFLGNLYLAGKSDTSFFKGIDLESL